MHRRSHRFMIWCLGAGLFAHACTSLSVAYFDQSMMFFWLNVAVISSMHSVHAWRLRRARCRSDRKRRRRPAASGLAAAEADTRDQPGMAAIPLDLATPGQRRGSPS